MITEDGTGIANAESYAAASDLTTYCQTRGLAVEITADQAVAYLLRATDYIDQTYRARSAPLTRTQGLQFPSYDPRAYRLVKKAAIFFAVEIATAGALTTRVEQTVKRQEDKLDGVGLTITEYDGAVPLDHYPQITAMLREVAALRACGVTSGRVTRDPWTDPAMPLTASQGALQALNVASGFGYNGWAAFTGWDSLQ